MIKKIICAALILAMLFAFAACGELDTYKEEQNAELTAYLQTKNQHNYNNENWTELNKTAQNAIQNINKASSKDEIDEILNKVKDDMDAIKAYPNELDSDILSTIKQDWLNSQLKPTNPDATISDVPQIFCLGVFKYYVVFGAPQTSLSNVTSETVENVYFRYTNNFPLHIWKDGEFCRLQYAVIQGILDQTDLLKLVYRYYDGGYYDHSNGSNIHEVFSAIIDDTFKLSYAIGEVLNLSGLAVIAIGTNGLVQNIDVNECTIDSTQFDSSQTGIYVIQITYKTLVCGISVTVL